MTPLANVDELEAAIAESNERPVLVFKHSRNCGVSCEALDELHDHVARAAASVSYRIITVQSHRQLSEAFAARFGIRHETPQAILLRNGQPVWSASHFRITARQLDQIVLP